MWSMGVGPLMDRNLVVWSRRQESKREKEADISWFTRKANRVLVLGSCCCSRHRVPSRVGEDTMHLLERVSEAQARK